MKNVTTSFILQRTSSNYEEIHKTGVYRLYHISKPDIYYIGGAYSTRKWREGFKQRWLCHVKDLKHKRHHSPFLQRIVNKYGLEGLRFEILKFCEPYNCLELEQYYLDFYLPFGIKGYNTCRIAGSTLGLKISEEKKAKRKPIDQYSLNGEFIRNWNSLNEASRELSINVSSIKDCCKQRFKQIKGYIFRYQGETNLPKFEEIRQKTLIDCMFDNKSIYTGTISEIIDKVPDGKQAIYKSIRNGNLTKSKWKYLKQKTNGKDNRI